MSDEKRKPLTHDDVKRITPGWKMAGYIGETAEPPGEVVYIGRFNEARRRYEETMAWFPVPNGSNEVPKFPVSIDARGRVVDADGVRVAT